MNRLIDFGVGQETPESSMSRGMRGFGTVLDAVMERRRMEQERKQLAAEKAAELEFRKQQEERLRTEDAMQSYDRTRAAEATQATAAAKLEQDRAEFAQKQRVEQQGAIAKAQEAQRTGGFQAAHPLLAAQGMRLRQRQADPMGMLENTGEPIELPMAAGEPAQEPYQRTRFEDDTEALRGQYEVELPGGGTAPWQTPEQEFEDRLAANRGRFAFAGPQMSEIMARQVALGEKDVVKGQLDREAAGQRARIAASRPTAGTTITPYQQHQIDEDERERQTFDFEGNPAGLAISPAEGKATRAKRAQALSLHQQLEELKPLVQQMGLIARTPGLGDLSAVRQQFMSGVNNILGPMSQFAGSGTPQEAEGKRTAAALSASLTQSPEVALKNIEASQGFVRQTYGHTLGSSTPGYKPKAPGGGGPGAAVSGKARDLLAKARGGR